MEMSLLPTGYRFRPTDKEIMDLLKMKMVDRDSSVENLIPQIHVLEYEPSDIFRLLSKGSNDRECYFFSPRKRKYARSDRADRCTKGGRWKPTGKRPKISTSGIKRRLTFYQGRSHPRKTGYIMHEYELNDMKDIVLCCLKRNDEETKNRDVSSNYSLDTLQDNEAEDKSLEQEANRGFLVQPSQLPGLVCPEQEANQELFIPSLQLYDGRDFTYMSSFDQGELNNQIIQQEANQELVFPPSQKYDDTDLARLSFEKNKLYDRLPGQEGNPNMLVPPVLMHGCSDSSGQSFLEQGEPYDDLDRLIDIDSFINSSPPESPAESGIVNE